MNTKAKGARNEHKSMRLLESCGYRCTRAASSLGVFDIIGVSATDIVLVQAKSNSWPSSLELEAIENFPAPANAKKLIHRWRDNARVPDVQEVA